MNLISVSICSMNYRTLTPDHIQRVYQMVERLIKDYFISLSYQMSLI